MHVVGVLMLLAGVISVYLPPLVGLLRWAGVDFLMSVFGFFVTAALMGSVLPLVCRLAISPDDQAGRRVSLVYVSNIMGSALGSLLVGFVMLQYFGLRQVSLQLATTAALAGSIVLLFSEGKFRIPPVWAVVFMTFALVAVPVASRFYSNLFERLIWGGQPQANEPFAHIVENRNGVIEIGRASCRERV